MARHLTDSPSSLPKLGRMPLAEALRAEIAQYALSCVREGFKEGTRAFLEKRRPPFRDR